MTLYDFMRMFMVCFCVGIANDKHTLLFLKHFHGQVALQISQKVFIRNIESAPKRRSAVYRSGCGRENPGWNVLGMYCGYQVIHLAWGADLRGRPLKTIDILPGGAGAESFGDTEEDRACCIRGEMPG